MSCYIYRLKNKQSIYFLFPRNPTIVKTAVSFSSQREEKSLNQFLHRRNKLKPIATQKK